MNKLFTTSMLIFTILISCSKDKLEDIGITNEEVFTSQIVNDDYPLYYFLPIDYKKSKKYPVVYLLDGDWHTERIANEINKLWNENSIPQCILVGIGNANERGRDYVYPEDEYNEGFGHADKFYEFIKTELIPHVENKYSIDSTSRYILGHSAGGFFTLFAMFSDENSDNPMFKGYISASPAVFWENAYLLNMEQKLSEKTNDLNCSLFISTGSDEGVAINILAKEVYNRLLERKYSGLKIEHKEFKDKAHEGALLPGFIEGLKFTFNN